MQGWKIFSHSMNMVVRNLAIAIRIALIPALIGVVALVAMFLVTDVSTEILTDEVAMEQLLREQGSGAFVGPFILFVLIFLVIEFWVFVSWHRFILLEEYPTGWIPKFRADRILAYFGRGLLLGLIGAGLMLVMMLFFWVVGLIAGQSAGIIIAPMMFFGWIFILISLYRLTPILPAAAIGKPLKISEAWAATRGEGWALVLVLVTASVVQILMQIVASLSMAVFAPLGFVFLLLTMLVMTLVNVSILTTLYGHYIEGRALD